MLHQDLLAAEGTVTASTTVGVAAHVAVRVTHVVTVLLVEDVVRDFREGGAPEHQAFFQREADAFQEEGILQTPIVLEMGIAPEAAV